MEMNNFARIAEKNSIPRPYLKNALWAFFSGGLIGIIGQLIVNMYQAIFDIDAKEAAIPMIVTIIFISSLLTAIGIFDNIAQYTGAGTFIPITGFANALTSSALEGKSEGLVYGIGGGMFKLAGSVITYGVVSAYILGIIHYLLTS